MGIYSHLHFTVNHVEVYLMIWQVYLVFFFAVNLQSVSNLSSSHFLRVVRTIFWVMAQSYYICLRTSFLITSISTILHRSWKRKQATNWSLQNWLIDRIQERFFPIYLWIKWISSHWWWNMLLSKQLSFIISKKQWKMNVWLRAKVFSAPENMTNTVNELQKSCEEEGFMHWRINNV